VIPARGDRLELLDVVPIKGGGLVGAFLGAAKAARALPRARALLASIRPRAVLSVGGYAAGPIALAARALSIPLAILEPNSILGLANRLLAPFARRAYLAFPELELRFRPSVALCTGVPLRKSFAPSVYTDHPGQRRILILGGSQGAAWLNETAPRSLARIAQEGGVRLIHQTGPSRDVAVRKLYEELGTGPFVSVVPFLDDMAEALSSADIVITRAGASALAELCAVGRPSVLIPFPFAADAHQQKNAAALAAAGAAVCLVQAETSEDRLAAEIRALLAAPERREHMARSARERGRPFAARTVALDLLRLSGIETSAPSAGESLAEVPHV
jgi:UDP-N-acetylglucosamine--N-acetylmuramyl-(pentapeptide) pyrophosphoryl-undecaprenol N-acetylglucosamine transferase